MANVPISELGLGGAVAYILVRETFTFIKYMKNNKTNGDANGKHAECVQRTEFEEHKKSVVYKDNCALIKEFNKERFDHIDSKLNTVESLIRNGGK